MVKTKCPGHTGVCPFCKSEKVISPYVNSITGEPVERYCCGFCKKNDKYADGRRDSEGNKPEGVSKW